MTPEQLERKRKANREYMARYRAANPEKSKQRYREWCAANKEKKPIYDRARYKKIMSDAQKKALFKKAKNIYRLDNIDAARRRSRKYSIKKQISEILNVRLEEVPQDLLDTCVLLSDISYFIKNENTIR